MSPKSDTVNSFSKIDKVQWFTVDEVLGKIGVSILSGKEDWVLMIK